MTARLRPWWYRWCVALRYRLNGGSTPDEIAAWQAGDEAADPTPETDQ